VNGVSEMSKVTTPIVTRSQVKSFLACKTSSFMMMQIDVASLAADSNSDEKVSD